MVISLCSHVAERVRVVLGFLSYMPSRAGIPPTHQITPRGSPSFEIRVSMCVWAGGCDTKCLWFCTGGKGTRRGTESVGEETRGTDGERKHFSQRTSRSSCSWVHRRSPQSKRTILQTGKLRHKKRSSPITQQWGVAPENTHSHI